MNSPERHYTRSAGVALAVAALTLAAAVLGPRLPVARAAGTGQLQQRLSAGENRVSGLSDAVQAAGTRVHGFDGSIEALQRQISSIQADLDAKRAQLLAVRTKQGAAEAKLLALQAAERHAQSVLSEQLVGSYEADRPDLISVVLESTGFDNLLDRLAFAQRVGNHDAQIVGQVQASRRAVAAQATRLGALSLRQQRLSVQRLYARNRLARDQVTLLTEQLAAERVRHAKAGQLSIARGQVSSLRTQLSKLRAAQAAQTPQTSAGSGRGSTSSPNSRSSSGSPTHAVSSGGFTFPLPKADTSPPSTWSLDDGVDISAPGGTPEYAVCAAGIQPTRCSRPEPAADSAATPSLTASTSTSAPQRSTARRCAASACTRMSCAIMWTAGLCGRLACFP
jgi:peptidoglycan hydrolase CwlO-like protein